MAQSLTNKVRKLAAIYNIDLIIQTAIDVRNELLDEQAWDNLTDDEKLKWFFAQCEKYNLNAYMWANSVRLEELRCDKKAYFMLWLPKSMDEEANDNTTLHLEIGGSYVDDINGGIWATAKGLKGKEQQIAEVMRLHALGQ